MKKIILGIVFSLFVCIGSYANDVDTGLSYYEKGNYSEAIKFYSKACDSGDADGCTNLGTMYKRGQGVKQNNSKAKELFGKACDMKFEDGCKNYAILNRK